MPSSATIQTEPAYSQRVPGYMAALDLRDRPDLLHRPHVIEAVEPGKSHPAIGGRKPCLRLQDVDLLLPVCPGSEQRLRAVWGLQWSGQSVRVMGVIRVWNDSTLVWGLAVVPLQPCRQCGDLEEDVDAAGLCDWCRL